VQLGVPTHPPHYIEHMFDPKLSKVRGP
jgi:hypothetical protein